MNRRFDKTILLVSVTGVALALSLLLPFLSVLEILLIAFGLLAIVWATSEVDDRIHLHHFKQQWRILNFQRFKSRRPARPDHWSLN